MEKSCNTCNFRSFAEGYCYQPKTKNVMVNGVVRELIWDEGKDHCSKWKQKNGAEDMSTFISMIRCGKCNCEYDPDAYNGCPQCGHGEKNIYTTTGTT